MAFYRPNVRFQTLKGTRDRTKQRGKFAFSSIFSSAYPAPVQR